MRQNVLKYSALLAVAVAACSEPTGVNGGLTPEGPNFVVTASQGTITKIAGDLKFWTIGDFNFQDPAVLVRDLSGNPIANEPVTFTTVTLTGVTRSRVGLGTGCSGTFGSTSVTVNTNASGQAVVRWCSVAGGGQSMTATVGTGGVSTTFEGVATTGGVAPTVTIVSTNLSPDNSGTMGGQQTLGNPTVHVGDGTIVLPSVNVKWTPTGNGTVYGLSTINTRTNTAGQAGVVWRLRTTAGANTITAEVEGHTSAGVPATSRSQTVTAKPVGTAANCRAGCTNVATTAVYPAAASKFGPKDPVVQFVTSDGTSVGEGVRVVVSYGTGSNACGSVLGPTEYPGLATNQLLTFTDANGFAAAPWCNTTASAGSRTITFAAGDISRVITGTVNNDFSSTGTLTRASGNTYTCTVGGTATPDMTVTFTDANGAPVSGGTITFTAPAGGTVANGAQSGNSITVTTNSAGQAAARYTCNNSAGTQTVSATSSTGASTTFSVTASAGSSSQTIIKIAGDNQTATAGSTVPRNPNVLVTDQFGNPVDGVVINFTPSGPSGAPATTAGQGTATGNTTCGSGCWAVTTGSQGQSGSSATVWTLSTTVGTNTLNATISGTSNTVTFTATGN